MIDKVYKEYQLTCDCCGEILTDFSSFNSAVDYKADNGWKSVNTGGVWQDICPDCQEKNKPVIKTDKNRRKLVIE